MNEPAKRVLVVDDDESAVAFVRAVLEVDKHEVVGVSDGLAGLSHAKKKHPDLIVLDVYMPHQPGFYTLRDLKADPTTKDIPIIMLTSVRKRLGVTFSSQDLYDFLGIEPDVFLEKPVDPTLLRQWASKLLGSGSTTNASGTEREN